MKKYYIDYMGKGGDMCHVWVNAASEAEAKSKVMREYHDVNYIVYIH